MSYIFGRNQVLEALKSGRTINKILISQRAHGSAIKEILSLARQKKIPLHNVPAQKIDSLYDRNNQGVAAEVTEAKYFELDELCDKIKDNPKPLLVILDGIVDPHNVGAIIRNAAALGADGVVIGKWRATGLTETVSRTSAGAVEHMPVARVTNIAQTLNELKEKNYWIYGAEADGKPIQEEKFSFPCALVIGSEGQGLHRLVKERCDFLISISQTNLVSSLNASCASAITLHEIYKQKRS